MFLGEQLTQRHLARGHVKHLLTGTDPWNEAEQTNPPGIASTSILNAATRRSSASMVGGITGRSLMTVSPSPGCAAPDDDAGLIQARSGCIEEESLSRLGLDRIEPYALDRRTGAGEGTDNLSSTLVDPSRA